MKREPIVFKSWKCRVSGHLWAVESDKIYNARFCERCSAGHHTAGVAPPQGLARDAIAWVLLQIRWMREQRREKRRRQRVIADIRAGNIVNYDDDIPF